MAINKPLSHMRGGLLYTAFVRITESESDLPYALAANN